MKQKQFLADTAWIIVGSAVFSVGLECFAVPHELLLGGATGVATVVHHFSGLPIGIGIALINAPLLVWGVIQNGVRRMARTLYATAWFSLVLTVGERLLVFRFRGEVLVSALFGGLIMGIGLSVVFARDYVTGGTDLLALLLTQKFAILSFEKWILVLDTLIVAAGALALRSVTGGLYSALMILVYSLVVGQSFAGRSQGKTLMVITENSEAVKSRLYRLSGRGCTTLYGYGGKNGEEKTVLLCALRDRQLSGARTALREIDPGAFVIVLRATEIWGEGFFAL